MSIDVHVDIHIYIHEDIEHEVHPEHGAAICNEDGTIAASKPHKSRGSESRLASHRAVL